MLHIDVMDGHFVPNISLGAPVIKALRRRCALPFDVHLMISEPLKYIDDFIAAGADIISVHAESDGDTQAAIDLINAAGKTASLAVKPATPADTVFPCLEKLGMVLVMTVEPGFGGQSFMESQLPKIEKIRNECERRGLAMDIQVDGGITEKTLPLALSAGANVFVAGSFIFRAADVPQAISRLKAFSR